MPLSLIKQYKEQGITSLDDLADLFEVSKQAMSIRLGLAA
jgi:DeoR/GlpR family transcriptional regulator of sugar metabolism